jgi:hypothetical protein
MVSQSGEVTKHREVVTTSGTYPWSFVKQIFHSGQNQVMVATVNYLLSRPLVEEELLTLPEHLSSPPVFSGVRVTRSLVLCVCFVDPCLSFCAFRLAIVLSVLLP